MTYRNLISFLWPLIRPYRWSFLTVFLLAMFWSLDATIWPYLLGKVIDILTRFEADRAAAWGELKLWLVAGLILWLSIEIAFRVQGFMLARTIPKMESNIRMTMFNHVERHSPKYFNEHFAGSLANKISDMTSQVTVVLQLLLTMLNPVILTSVLGVLFFLNIHFVMALLLALLILVHIGVSIYFASRVDKAEEIHGEARSTLSGKIVDSLTNNFAVNLFYRFKDENAFVEVYQEKERETNKKAKYAVEIMRVFLGQITFFIAGIGMNAAMIYLWFQGSITTGQVAQIFNTTWNIVQFIWMFSFTIPTVFSAIGLMKQALSVMEDPQDLGDDPQAKPLVVTSGEIVFEDVTFHYGAKKLFENKDVKIRGGEKVGLVGYSGAGKSTFINLILRFFPIESGSIYIDGQNISKVTLESLRRQVALIPQDPLLFHRTLRENIRFGRLDATDEDIYQVAKWAHCEEFIRRIPEGYDAVVGERGTKLSGGERQRIAIARAMLANAPILILDEATSSLDSITEQYIQESLERLMQNRTTVVIAHRLSTLAKMDRILVFDQGKVVEEGSHRDLLGLNRQYARLWEMQAGGFLPDSI
jgi:ATP-binding cassette subfamily B protein